MLFLKQTKTFSITSALPVPAFSVSSLLFKSSLCFRCLLPQTFNIFVRPCMPLSQSHAGVINVRALYSYSFKFIVTLSTHCRSAGNFLLYLYTALAGKKFSALISATLEVKSGFYRLPTVGDVLCGLFD